MALYYRLLQRKSHETETVRIGRLGLDQKNVADDYQGQLMLAKDLGIPIP